MKIERIEWRDSFGCSPNWGSLDKDMIKPLHCVSVGLVIHEDEDCVVVAPHWTEQHPGMDTQHYCGDMTIPTVSIVSRTELT